MAEASHLRLAATAVRLIQKHGRSLVFQEARAVADSNKPWRGPDLDADPTSITAIGAVVDYDLSEIDGNAVLRGDKRCLTSLGGETNPRLFKTVLDGGKIWRVISINTINPGEVMIVHDIQLRQ